jgi:hypothetical protein
MNEKNAATLLFIKGAEFVLANRAITETERARLSSYVLKLKHGEEILDKWILVKDFLIVE